MAQIQHRDETYYAVCDHCGGDFPEENLYQTANEELVCDYTWAPVPIDSCREWLTEDEVR